MPKITRIDYTYDRHPAEQVEASPDLDGCGWINGLVTLDDGRTFEAGGGWVDADGKVEPYGMTDAGEVVALADALRQDPADTMSVLVERLPKKWDSETIEEGADDVYRGDPD